MYELINKKGILIVKISGEIDHHSSRIMRTDIDSNMEHSLPKKLVLDFSNVSFMDSSGIGLIIGRYKLIKNFGGEVFIVNSNDYILRLLEIAGIDKIAKITNESEVFNDEN